MFVNIQDLCTKLSTVMPEEEISMAQFAVDTNTKAVDDARLDMLKNGVRQMRYRLKKKYFNGVPANQKARVCQARKTVGRSSCRSGQGLGAILHMRMLRSKKNIKVQSPLQLICLNTHIAARRMVTVNQ